MRDDVRRALPSESLPRLPPKKVNPLRDNFSRTFLQVSSLDQIANVLLAISRSLAVANVLYAISRSLAVANVLHAISRSLAVADVLHVISRSLAVALSKATRFTLGCMLCGHVLHAISHLAAVNAFHGFVYAHIHSNLSSTLCRRDSRDSTSSSRLSYVTQDVPSSSSCNSSSLASLAAAALARWTTGEFVDASHS